jgi:dTMP kinase
MGRSSFFLTLEGGEGAGKTTLQTYLAGQLAQAGYDPLCTYEPGDTPIGRSLRQLLLQSRELAPTTELMLYAADRAEHVAHVIQPALAEGRVVICDRFTDSTLAYQGYGRGLDLDLVHQLNRMATQGLVPDLTLWLDVPVAEGLARAQTRAQVANSRLDRMEQAQLDFHERLRNGFRSLAAAAPNRIQRIDASQSVEAVAAAAWELVRAVGLPTLKP